MSLILEQKKRKKKQSVDEIFDWAREQFVKAAELYHKRKRDVILEVARRLEEAEFEQSKISQEIIHKLDGLVDASWVNKVLTDFPQYKDEYRVRNVKKRNFSRINPTKSAQFEPYGSKYVEPADEAAAANPDTIEEQPRPKEVQGIHNISPDEYKLEELEEYDSNTHIGIIKYLDNNIASLHQSVMKWDKVVHDQAVENTELRKENSVLKKQLEEVQPFIELLSIVTPESKARKLERLQSELAVLKERGWEQ